MRLTVATEAKFTRCDGVVRSDTGGRAYAFWARYLEVFESVTVLARVVDVQQAEGHAVAGAGVMVAALDGYDGMLGLATSIRKVRREVRLACDGSDTAYLARVPGAVGAMMISHLRRTGRAYGLEVVGDPFDVLGSGILPRGTAGVVRRLGGLQMRRQCAGAAAVAYVTREVLQHRYPASDAAFVTHYSSVELPSAAFVAAPPTPRAGLPILVAVGSQSQRYKGHDVLIDAVALLRDRGVDVEARLVGDGRQRAALERQAAHRDVTDRVTFVGKVSTGPAVRAQLDAATLFVLPSRTEGLPRALLEAMARGLPCIGSSVGGVPELLDDTDMVSPGEAGPLADALFVVLQAPLRRAEMGARNLLRAAEYGAAVLGARRADFYRALAQISCGSGTPSDSAHVLRSLEA